MGVHELGAFWYDKWLYPIEWVVAWIMYLIHKVLNMIGLSGSLDGFAWVLSIVGLTIVVRITIIPLFFKQIKASRGMQLIQPEMTKLREKYKGRTDPESRQAMSQEMMALYKTRGANPMSSCWPLLLQMPVFFSLFSVLRSTRTLAAGQNWAGHTTLGPIDQTVAKAFESSSFLGVRLSQALLPWDQASTNVRILCIILILAMVSTQFFTMRQLTMKNMPQTATDDNNPMMRTNKMMMWTMPLIMGVTGIYFQFGVLVYWFTTNLWTAGQQAWTINRMPSPGSEAYEKLMKKNKDKYETFRKELTAEYESKISVAEDNSPEEAEKLRVELAGKLSDRKLKLGLEQPKPKVKAKAEEDSAPAPRVQPTRLTRAQRKARNVQSGKTGPKETSEDEIQRRRQERRAAVKKDSGKRQGKKPGSKSGKNPGKKSGN